MIAAATAELLSVRGAALALKVNPSTISRYLKDHPDLNLGDESLPKVNIEVLRRHRAQNVNPALRGIKAAKALAAGGGEVTPAASPIAPPPAATGVPDGPNYRFAKAVRETVLAKRARIDLDEKRRLLVPRREVEDAVFEAGAVLLRDLLDLAGRLSERISTMDDPRAIAALIETEHRQVLAALAASLRDQAAAEDEPRAPAEIPLYEGDPINGP